MNGSTINLRLHYWIVKVWSQLERSGGVVLDPFSGSGTTCAVAKSLGRHYMGFEIDKGYWEMSQRRLDGVAGVIKKGGAVMEQLSLL